MAGMGKERVTGGPGSERQKEFFINFEPSMVSVGACIEPDVQWHNWSWGASKFKTEDNGGSWKRCTFQLNGEEAILRIRTNDDGEAQEAQVLIGDRMIGQIKSEQAKSGNQFKVFKYSEVPSDKQ